MPQLKMMLRCSLLLYRFTAEKILFLLILFVLMRPLRIFALHLYALLHRQLRQMPNEEHQFPTIVLRVGTSAKGWHARKAHSVFDDPKKFAVGKLLGLLQTKVGRLRVQTFTVHRVAAAIVAVAARAMIREVRASLLQRLVRRGDGIVIVARVRGNGKVPHVSRDHCFHRGGGGPRA